MFILSKFSTFFIILILPTSSGMTSSPFFKVTFDSLLWTEGMIRLNTVGLDLLLNIYSYF